MTSLRVPERVPDVVYPFRVPQSQLFGFGAADVPAKARKAPAARKMESGAFHLFQVWGLAQHSVALPSAICRAHLSAISLLRLTHASD